MTLNQKTDQSDPAHEQIQTRRGLTLNVQKAFRDDTIEVSIRTDQQVNCVLHWAVTKFRGGQWQLPPESARPAGSTPRDRAVQTPFSRQDGASEVTIRLDPSLDYASLVFVLYYPDESAWDNNGGHDYSVDLPSHREDLQDPMEVLKQELGDGSSVSEREYPLRGDRRLAVMVTEDEDQYRVQLAANLSIDLLLHWGVLSGGRVWQQPPEDIRPPQTRGFDERAVQTPFEQQNGLLRLTLSIPKEGAPGAIAFVLLEPSSGQWFKDSGSDFLIRLQAPAPTGESLDDPQLRSLADRIIEKEVSKNSWTLMHRFNLCFDLRDQIAPDDVTGLALLVVWLRFSALRQLDWQRNYNTKPRELSHSMNRLTLKLANRYSSSPPEAQAMIRLIMTTLGRGGPGQRIRDGVLEIMHRHHIKEVSGHFMEEWHQKLHNNTTPDDIVICEALLEFFRTDGDLDRFYERLNEGGVTKERLESYERPIKSDPDFIPDLKDALIHDFEDFLGLLKSVHSGTDLGAAIEAARPRLDVHLHQ